MTPQDSTTAEEMKTEIKRFKEANENEDMSFHNLWDTSKAVIKGKLIAISAHKRKTERRQMDHLTSRLREHESNSKKSPTNSRKKEIIKIQAEINEIENKQTIQKTNKSKSWFFEKINKIDTPLARLIKKKEEKEERNQINQICEGKTVRHEFP